MTRTGLMYGLARTMRTAGSILVILVAIVATPRPAGASISECEDGAVVAGADEPAEFAIRGSSTENVLLVIEAASASLRASLRDGAHVAGPWFDVLSVRAVEGSTGSATVIVVEYGANDEVDRCSITATILDSAEGIEPGATTPTAIGTPSPTDGGAPTTVTGGSPTVTQAPVGAPPRSTQDDPSLLFPIVLGAILLVLGVTVIALSRRRARAPVVVADDAPEDIVSAFPTREDLRLRRSLAEPPAQTDATLDDAAAAAVTPLRRGQRQRPVRQEPRPLDAPTLSRSRTSEPPPHPEPRSDLVDGSRDQRPEQTPPKEAPSDPFEPAASSPTTLELRGTARQRVTRRPAYGPAIKGPTLLQRIKFSPLGRVWLGRRNRRGRVGSPKRRPGRER